MSYQRVVPEQPQEGILEHQVLQAHLVLPLATLVLPDILHTMVIQAWA